MAVQRRRSYGRLVAHALHKVRALCNANANGTREFGASQLEQERQKAKLRAFLVPHDIYSLAGVGVSTIGWHLARRGAYEQT